MKLKRDEKGQAEEVFFCFSCPVCRIEVKAPRPILDGYGKEKKCPDGCGVLRYDGFTFQDDEDEPNRPLPGAS